MKNPFSLDAPATVFVPSVILAVLAFSMLLAFLLLKIPHFFAGLAIGAVIVLILRILHYVFLSN